MGVDSTEILCLMSDSLFILSYAAGSGVNALRLLSYLLWHLTAPRVFEMGRSHRVFS